MRPKLHNGLSAAVQDNTSTTGGMCKNALLRYGDRLKPSRTAYAVAHCYTEMYNVNISYDKKSSQVFVSLYCQFK